MSRQNSIATQDPEILREARRPAPEEGVERVELGEPIHRHTRFYGMSLAFKVALVTTGTLAVLMGGLSWILYSSSRDALYREIDAFGVSLAKALALPDVAAWDPAHATLVQAAERVVSDAAAYEEYLRTRFGILIAEPLKIPKRTRGKGTNTDEGPRLSPEFLAQQKRAVEAFEKAQARNVQRLAPLVRYQDGARSVPSEIIDAFILHEDRDSSLIRANPDSKVFRTEGEARSLVVEGDDGTVETEALILDGTLDGHGAARSYSYPVRDDEGRITHRAYVLLSRQRIDDRLDAILRKLMLLTVVFIAIGGGISHLVTIRMTSPIKTLIEDVDIVTAGDVTHRTHVHTRDEIGLLARTMDTMVRRMNEARIKHDEEIATDVHRKLVPDAIPVIPHFDVDVLHKLTTEFGGAYYDFLDLPDGQIGLVVAQASRSGIAAAMNVVMAGVLLQAEAHETADPAQLLRRANGELYRDIREGMSISALVAVLDPKTRRIRACGAGELPFILFRSASGKAEAVKLEGSPLGVDSGEGFSSSLRPRELTLEPGDRLVLSNEGAEKLTNKKGEPLGARRWLTVVERTCGDGDEPFVKGLRARLNRFLGKEPVRDDVVVVTLEAKT